MSGFPAGTTGQGAVIPTGLTPEELLYAASLGLQSIVNTRYMLVAAVVLAVYEWLLNLGWELQLIHRSRWTLVKAAYLFSRYYTLFVLSPYLLWIVVADHSLVTCEKHFRAPYLLMLPSIISAQMILMLRTYAFANQRRWVLWTLAVSLIGVIVGTIVIVLKYLELVTVVFDLFGGKSGCFASTNLTEHFSFDMALIFVLIFCFDALNIAIIVGHVLKDRNMRGDLYQTVLQHGFFYYIATCTVNIISTASYFAPERTLNGFASWFAWVLPSMLSCSLVLALRHVSSPTQTDFMFRVDAAVDDALEMMDAVPSVATRSTGERGGECERVVDDAAEETPPRDTNGVLPGLSVGELDNEYRILDARTRLKHGSTDRRIQGV
ncbi:hypothetical protein PENSPDRAFT_757921 [Peniophora sp. CONT]|nr:hypothetical protein PENSPDRAFT_757921 [Peniophora sp. CONT]